MTLTKWLRGLAAILALLTILLPGAVWAQTSEEPPAQEEPAAEEQSPAQEEPPAQPTAMSSLLVKLVAGLSAEDQAAVIERNGGTQVSSIPALRLRVVAVPTAQLEAIRAAYAADPQVQAVEENKTRQSEAMPSDALYATQWALPKIGWESVFGSVTPSGQAKVAVLDTGVDANHPDLAGRVVPGHSILDGSNGMTDPSGHGTWLAGIIAANTNNSLEGIAGVAFEGVKVMPVTVLDANGLGQDSDVIAGVIWAADNGADVILMAFSNPGFSPNLQDAIDYAWSKGVVLVAAVGNNASAENTFPAGDRGVMGVASTDQNDAQAYFSNEGQSVFIAAPGVEIPTTDIGGAYNVISGSSSSAAIIAGVAGFMKAVDPSLSNGVIVGRIARNADPAGTQEQTGNGRVNMARALADTSTEPVQPAGTDPVGAGGPFVGPYVAAANNYNVAPTPSTVNPGSSNSFSFAFTATNSGGGAATATLDIPASWSVPTSVTVTNGSPACATASLNSVVVRQITFTHNCGSGDKFTISFTSTAPNAAQAHVFLVSVASNDPIVNVKGNSATSLTSSPNSSNFGQSVTFTATVTAVAPATGTPAGTVTFKEGATTIGTGTLNAGAATFTTSTLTAGTHSITAVYGDSANFNTSTSGAVSQVVNQVGTTTALTLANGSPNPSNAGQSVTFNVKVTSAVAGAGTPTGTVLFKDGSTTIGSDTLNGGGNASFTTSSLSAGTHSITAQYVGDTNFAGSTSGVINQVVNSPATATTLISSQNPSFFGQSVTFTATVTSGGGTPTGSVTFKDGVATLGTIPLSGGVATLMTSTLNVGPHSITAEYVPTGTFTASTSPAVNQQVNKRATSTAVESSKNPSTFGESVMFTATVTGTGPGAGNPNADGNVTFKAGGTPIVGCSTVTVDAAGKAQCSTAALAVTVSPHAITAEYRGGTSFGDSDGTLPGGQTVNKRATQTTVESSNNPSTFGESVTFTATVAGTGDGAGNPNADGNVTFKAAGTPIAGCSTVAVDATGKAQCSTAALAVTVSPHAITAEYRSGTSFADSDGTLPGGQTVNKRATQTTVESSKNPSTFGELVTFTATVAGTGAGAGNPNVDGNVTFKADNVAIASCSNLAVDGSGKAQCSTAALTVAGSPHVITAEYGNAASFADSTGTLPGGQTVNKRSTQTTVESSKNPSTFGESVTFTATVAGTGAGAGNPNADGNVTFKANNVAIGSCANVAVDAAGKAQCSTAALTVAGSPHVITAEYGNAANFADSTGTLPGGQTVNKRSTQTTVESSKNPSTFGESVTFTATVAGTGAGAGNPNVDGDVTFKASGVAIASCSNVVVNSSGQAQCSTAALTAAGSPHTITAEYRNGANFANSDGTLPGAQVVNKRTTSTAVTSNPNPSTFGESVTFTATVTGTGDGAGNPNADGNVTFKAGGVAIAGCSTVAVNAAGKAYCSTAALTAVGSPHTITAEYRNGANFANSDGTLPGGQTVNKRDTSTTLASSSNPSILGQPVTLTATVLGTGAGAGTPGAGEGSVTFKNGTTVLCNAVAIDASGQATCTTSAFGPGDNALTAQYSGAGNFNSSTGNLVQQVHYDWTGFFQPVENLPKVNGVKAGQAIPVKFSLGGDQGLNILAEGYPKSIRYNCDTNALTDEIEETVTAGNSSLQYDPATGQYIYVWKTDKSWASSCRELTVKLNDNTEHKARFQFKK